MKTSTGIKKLLFMIFVLTPLSAIQSFFGIFFAMVFAGYSAYFGGDLSTLIFMIIVFGLILLAVNWLVLLIRFSSQNSIFFHILEFIISPLRFPLQLVSDILAFIALFKDIDVCPINEPDISVDGFWHAFLIYTLEYEPGGKKDSQDLFNLRERNRSRRRSGGTGGRRPTASPSYDYDKPDYPTDNRTRDPGIFSSALEKEIDSQIIYSSLGGIPHNAAIGYNVSWDSGYLHCSIFGKNISLSGTLVLRASYDDAYIIRRDLENAVSTTKSHLSREVKECIRTVRESYRGFDNEWNINISIDARYEKY